MDARFRFDTEYIVDRQPYSSGGGVSQIAGWHYRRERGTWRVYLELPNIEAGEPFEGSMVGNAICDDFGVLRIVGGLR